MLRPRKSIESLFALLALNNYIRNSTPTSNKNFEFRYFSNFKTMTFRDRDSRSRLEVQVRDRDETFKNVSRDSLETGLENFIIES